VTNVVCIETQALQARENGHGNETHSMVSKATRHKWAWPSHSQYWQMCQLQWSTSKGKWKKEERLMSSQKPNERDNENHDKSTQGQ